MKDIEEERVEDIEEKLGEIKGEELFTLQCDRDRKRGQQELHR
jgi:hypothetical protein